MEKMWLDDVRPAPDGWAWAKSYDEAIAILSKGETMVASLDYDLGLTATGQVGEIVIATDNAAARSGFDVAVWIWEQAARGRISAPFILCHSINPHGREMIGRIIREIEALNEWPQK